MAPAPTADPAVVDHPEAQRYEIVIDGQAAGFAEYRLVGPDYATPDYATPDYATPDYDTPDYDTMVFTHTVIQNAFEGCGMGSRLAKAALDAARTRRLWVRPECSFFVRYIERHGEYADLVRT